MSILNVPVTISPKEGMMYYCEWSGCADSISIQEKVGLRNGRGPTLRSQVRSDKERVPLTACSSAKGTSSARVAGIRCHRFLRPVSSSSSSSSPPDVPHTKPRRICHTRAMATSSSPACATPPQPLSTSPGTSQPSPSELPPTVGSGEAECLVEWVACPCAACPCAACAARISDGGGGGSRRHAARTSSTSS